MAAAVTRSPQSPSVAPVGTKDRLFYGGMAVAMAVTVFVGFAPTYYGRFLQGGRMATISGGPFTPLVHVHGGLFTYIWGGLLFVVSVPLRLALSGTGAWRAFAEFLTKNI